MSRRRLIFAQEFGALSILFPLGKVPYTCLGGDCADLALFDKRCIPPLTLINCVQTPPKILHINGDPPFILEIFLGTPLNISFLVENTLKIYVFYKYLK